MSPHRPHDEVRPLTGIRGFAALWVVAFHFHDTFVRLVPQWEVFGRFARRGPLGVDMFFILSGFILCHVYEPWRAPFSLRGHLDFLWVRIARIWPNHVVTIPAIALAVAIGRARGLAIPGDFPFRVLPFQLTMTHAWYRSPGGDWNDVSWSVSSEWFAYVFLFPLASLWLARRPPWLLGAFACAGLVILWPVIAYSTISKDAFPVLRVTCGFLAGVALYGVAIAAPRLTAFTQRWLTPFAVLYVALQFATFHYVTELVLLVTPVLLLGLSAERSAVAHLLASRTANWLGRTSYALYMSHEVSERLLQSLLPAARFAGTPLALRAGVLAAHWAVVFLLAAALFYGVEQPARIAFRSLGRRRAPALAPVR